MESTNLTKAHEHVRNAATATYSSGIVQAGAEHELAASAFHDAAEDTHNEEALRILGLLEAHHHKLARLIKEPPRKKEKDADTASRASESTLSPPHGSSTTRASSPGTSSPTRAPSSRRRLPQPSIASNLAEKRGIPGARRSTPTASSAPVTGALATRNEHPSTPVRDLLQRQSWKTDQVSKDSTPQSTKKETPSPARDVHPPPDDNFRRFYSAFGGVISAISAPLAFTSLPLNPTSPIPSEPPSEPQKPRSKSPEESRTIKTSEPDLTTLVSKSALRALREDQSGPLGPFANNESFYFVPTSGGTVSYANILRDQQGLHHAAQNPQLESIEEGDSKISLHTSSHEEFVDARENIGPPSPTLPRRPRSKGSSGVTPARTIAAGRGTGLKTMEELQLENETLRSVLDKQAKRLIMWETTSQSSYNALAQSFRARGGLNKHLSDPSALVQALAAGNVTPLPSPPAPSIPPQYQSPSSTSDPPTRDSPVSPSPSRDSDREKDKQRIKELEDLLASQSSRLDALEAEKEDLARLNEKNGQVIGRYREQWEKLKAGARKKEQERREKRIAELKAETSETKDSESGETGVEDVEEEPGFGKA
ncbi:hypothetical protein CC78DRAFT_528549 [Lojkania enalia]|uniref:Uncharacterized protein n=1 Tax=Lojkania enalia TaxID=147567 RepID=A0A9P4NBD0_9PLEO|nr:hypothetical protein CC78DRAFT_528549 [Didymosphaeria enalia]